MVLPRSVAQNTLQRASVRGARGHSSSWKWSEEQNQGLWTSPDSKFQGPRPSPHTA